MEGKGSLWLEFLDVVGNYPNDRADVFLSHTIQFYSDNISPCLTRISIFCVFAKSAIGSACKTKKLAS
jgi:hypothetical protein